MSKKGISIVESLIASAISAIVAAAIVVALVQGLRGIRQNGRWVKARMAAAMQMEGLRATPFANLPASDSTSFSVDGLPDAQGMVYVAASGSADLLKVTVTVTLDNHTWRQVSLITNPVP